jgi:nucleoside-diphosphate-sugar epimerase
VSSVAVHSFLGARNMDEDSPQLPTPFPYCQSKREAESLVREYHQRGAIETTIVRPGDVYGPGDRVALLRMAGLLERGLIPLVGKGQYLGALTYVENLADGIILAGSVPGAAGRTYVITDGIEVSWREYFDSLASAIGAPAPRLSIHPTLAWAAASLLETVYRALGIRQRPPITRYLAAHLRADFHFRIDRAQRELGYVPAVGFEEAIRRTAAWYCSLG